VREARSEIPKAHFSYRDGPVKGKMKREKGEGKRKKKKKKKKNNGERAQSLCAINGATGEKKNPGNRRGGKNELPARFNFPLAGTKKNWGE